MQLDELKRYLGARAKIDVPVELARFERETGSRDFDQFLSWLHRQRIITSDTLRELHGRAPTRTPTRISSQRSISSQILDRKGARRDSLPRDSNPDHKG